ncbi:hypothetical protein BDZ85DRAFT_286524 [Elsinoe ampelina]|uniref:Uncharacterized protein n=1 Tax=Elsinoe ampelina TaxID=302913 RepID=A0A6A6FXS8_9PEZI|nr:hypothetical protein BDZ85DRAFT_286524 [Elsinoe ampelina]
MSPTLPKVFTKAPSRASNMSQASTVLPSYASATAPRPTTTSTPRPSPISDSLWRDIEYVQSRTRRRESKKQIRRCVGFSMLLDMALFGGLISLTGMAFLGPIAFAKDDATAEKLENRLSFALVIEAIIMGAGFVLLILIAVAAHLVYCIKGCFSRSAAKERRRQVRIQEHEARQERLRGDIHPIRRPGSSGIGGSDIELRSIDYDPTEISAPPATAWPLV